MLSNTCFEVFHVDTGNPFRNKSYDEIVNAMGDMPRLGSPTMYLNTADKVNKWQSENTQFKVNKKYDPNWVSSAGVIGVWASSYLSWKKFLETDYDVLLIFEDDILVSKNFMTIANKYMATLPSTWEFFTFFTAPDSLFAYKKDVHDLAPITSVSHTSSGHLQRM